MKSAPHELGGLLIALQYVTDRSIAIDGGANVGLWSTALADTFNIVHAFEPARDTFEMLRRAVTRHHKNITPHAVALWSERANVAVVSPKPRSKSTACFVQTGGSVEAITVDSLKLPSCGLIKLDLEGAEMCALLGAEQTLRQLRPVVIVECYRHGRRFGYTEEDPGIFLSKLGAVEVDRHTVNRIYAWR